MITTLRHIVAIIMLPVTVAVLIPLWILGRTGATPHVGRGVAEIAVQLLGSLALAVGLVLFGASVAHFAVHGKGTLAPWDPPKRLVVRGPYRYVRNPMISGVLFVLVGEAFIMMSRPLARWAFIFFAINLAYIPLIEEPMLRKRFGKSYEHYRQHVWMFLPRLHPWTGNTRRL